MMDKAKQKPEGSCKLKEDYDWENSEGIAAPSVTAESVFDREGYVSESGPVQGDGDTAEYARPASHSDEFERVRKS